MSNVSAIAAQREIFLVCPKSREILRLSECIIGFPGRIPASPADKIVRLREKLAAEERRFNENLEAERVRRVSAGRRAANNQVGAVYPFIDPQRVNPADVQVLFDPVLLVAFHGATKQSNDVEVEFIAQPPTSEAEEQRIASLQEAVKKTSFKIYRVNLESGAVEVSEPKEYKPRSKLNE